LFTVQRRFGEKPAYLFKLERIQEMIANWILYSNTYKSMNADRSTKGSTGRELHATIPVTKTMTKKELENMSSPWRDYEPKKSYISHKTYGESVEYAIIDGLIGEEFYLNGLTGIVEGKTQDGDYIIKLDPNSIIEDSHIQLMRGEFMLVKSAMEVPQSDFEQKHASMIRKERYKAEDNLRTIDLIGKYTSDSLYW